MSKKFTKQQREVLARRLGYDGPMNMFDQFVKSDPAMERKYSTVVEKYMARGGMVKKYQEGGAVTTNKPKEDPLLGYTADQWWKGYTEGSNVKDRIFRDFGIRYNSKEQLLSDLQSPTRTSIGLKNYIANNEVMGQPQDPYRGFTLEDMRSMLNSNPGRYGQPREMSAEEFKRHVESDPQIANFYLSKIMEQGGQEAMMGQGLYDKYFAPGLRSIQEQYAKNENALKTQIDQTIQRGKEDTAAYLKDLVKNETNALLNSPDWARSKYIAAALREALPIMEAAPLSDEGFTIPNTGRLGSGTYPFSNPADKQIAIDQVKSTIGGIERSARLQTVQNLMAKYNLDGFNRAKNTWYDLSKPDHIEDAINNIIQVAEPIELENRVAPTLSNLYAQQEQLLQQKDRTLINYNEQATAGQQALMESLYGYSKVIEKEYDKKLKDLGDSYKTRYGEEAYTNPELRQQFNADAELIYRERNQKFDQLYSPDFDIRQPAFSELMKSNLDVEMAKLQQQREKEMASRPMGGLSPVQLVQAPEGATTGLSGLGIFDTPTGGTTPTTTPTVGTTGGTTTPTTGTTTPTTTPTVGTTSGTSATTTPQIPSTGGTGTTATTTPQLPTTGATGVGTGTTPTTTGATGTQMGNIPTTNTVPAVNIPQVTAATIPTEPGQMISPTGAPAQAAQIAGATVGGVAQVTPTTPQAAATMQATTATGAVSGELAGLQPAQGAVSEQAQVKPETMEPTSTALKDLQAAQGVAGQVTGAPTRELVAGELIEGPTVDRAAVEATLAKNEAAQGIVTEDMTVQGQLAKLTTDFEANNPPAWAAGALRNATAAMAQRGLAASSLAGQALIQATIESALPIASADAQIYREMGIQNLSNKQQMAVLSAQQRAAFLGQEFDQAFQTRVTNAATISEIANLNFSAKQQIALENARLTESVNLANLNNRQALVMANAAQIATLETANLNNRQQANVLNAQAFLQMDLTNLSNQQQTALFKSQSMIQSILSDQAAENAARQFNAASVNQVNQFYDGLTAQIKQFNATQANAMNQFNVSQINSVSEFNATQQNARDQFNAEYRRVIDQSNAEWRRNIALADTAAINRANEVNANAALGITTIEYNNLWQTYRDQIEYSWKTGENALDRENELARQVLAKQATIEAAKFQIEAAKYQALGSLAAQVFDKGGIAASIGGLIQGAAGSLAAGFVGIKNAITGSSTGYTVLPNNAKPGETGYGWTFASDGTNDIKIGPDGTTYYNGVEQDYNYGYGSSGYNQPDFEFLDNPNQDNYGYGEAPDMSIIDERE